MSLGTHPQQENVEIRHEAVTGLPGQFIRVGESSLRGSLAHVRRHRVHVVGRNGDGIDECRASPGLIALRVPWRQEPLITPPQVHAIPVDARGALEQVSEHAGAHTASREHGVVDSGECEPRGQGIRHGDGDGVLVVENHHLGLAHASPPEGSPMDGLPSDRSTSP